MPICITVTDPRGGPWNKCLVPLGFVAAEATTSDQMRTTHERTRPSTLAPAEKFRQERTACRRRALARTTQLSTWAALIIAAIGGLAAPVAQAADQRIARHRLVGHHPRSTVSRLRTARTTGAPPLTFGIYPGGAAGTVGPRGRLAPEDPAKRLAALESLRASGRPLVLHLYATYSAPGGWSAEQQVGPAVAEYTAAGFQIELVLTYRPADGGSSSDVVGFAEFVRRTVSSFGPNPQFVSLQVTNEANIGGAPNASDGYYASVKDALVEGVIAAKKEIRSGSFHQIKVGFNWAYSTDPGETVFWRYLGQRGGAAFANALDWVGLDAYPGTWGPPINAADLSGGTKEAIYGALSSLRQRYMPLAGIPARVALHVSENGYPTGPGRTEDMQVTAMKAAIAAVDSARAAYNVTDYRWFDLRDADSASGSFESRYGLLNDDYTRKPAFSIYRDLVARLSAEHDSASGPDART